MLISVLRGARSDPVSVSMSGAADSKVEVKTSDDSRFSTSERHLLSFLPFFVFSVMIFWVDK